MEKRQISARVVADSISPQGHRITTFVLTYPRIIHAEVMTHRLFSRNAASSRAIPFKKMVEDVENDPFIPIAFQKDHKGMQGVEYIINEEAKSAKIRQWITASKMAISQAKLLNFDENHLGGITKQLCNRLLEPFQWYTCLVTATEFDNFYELRCPKYKYLDKTFRSRRDWLEYANYMINTTPEGLENPSSEEEWWMSSESGAEIHIQALAEAMWDAQNESNPKELKAGEWHIPFWDKIDNDGGKFVKYLESIWRNKQAPTNGNTIERVKIAVARAARLSYSTHDGEINYEKDTKLHDQLLESKHYSPFEHCCRVMSDEEYYSFVKGKIPTQTDEFGITNLEMMPVSSGDPIVGFTGLNPTNGNKYGWCNNIRGFIQYRYLLENGNS